MEPSALQLVLQFVIAPLGVATIAVGGTLLGARLGRKTVLQQVELTRRDDYVREQRQSVAKLLRALSQYDEALIDQMSIMRRMKEGGKPEQPVQKFKTASAKMQEMRGEALQLSDELILLAGRASALSVAVKELDKALELVRGGVIDLIDGWESATYLERNEAGLLDILERQYRPAQQKLFDTAHDELKWEPYEDLK